VKAATSHINPNLSVYLGIRFTYLEVPALGMPAPRVSALAQLEKSCLTTRSYILGK